MISVRREAGGISFSVSVQPRSPRAGIEGVRGDALRVRLTAPPVEGAANRQCVEVLAEAFGVRKSDVAIVSGKSARLKRVRIHGAEAAAVERIVAALEKGAG